MKTLKQRCQVQSHGCKKALFLKWLVEWRDEASKMGLKTQYSYTKAIRSLRKYPLAINSGSDCKLLDGFGAKICLLLDERLKLFSVKEGCCDPDEVPCVNSMEYDRDEYSPTALAPRKHGSSKASKKTNLCEYIPRKNSGAFALTLTLFKESKISAGKGFMMKKQLMEAAQPLTEQSFSIPPAGSHYTAWSSMGTLIKKGLVTRFGNPAKYVITDAGCAVAQKLLLAECVNSFSQTPIFISSDLVTSDVTSWNELPENATDTRSCVRQTKTKILSAVDSSNDHISCHSDVVKMKSSQSNDDLPVADANPLLSNSFNFWYVDDDGNKVMIKDKATVLIDDELSVGFLIYAKYDELVVSKKRFRLDTLRLCDDVYVFAYLHNDDAPDIANAAIHANLNARTHLSTEVNANHNQRTESCLLGSSKTSIFVHTRQCILPDTVLGGNYVQSCDSENGSGHQKHLGIPDYRLQPGSFRVLLCVDNQEFYSSGSHNRELLIKALDQRGVDYDVRKLQIGDFLWIAQYKSETGLKVELVLDYIVERKRMDDLAGSVIDGRFKEQKYRLRNCGISNAIYLVEDYGSMQHLSLSEDALNQAIINTQVVDGFFVKRTQNTVQSAEYLTIMTEYLQSIYSKKTLLGFNMQFANCDVRNHVNAKEVRLMSFEEFNGSSIKTRALSVNEMFAKYLMQLYGLTAEKAASILQSYSTPTSLFAAYDVCGGSDSCIGLLAALKYGPMRRNIGVQLSKVASVLHCTSNPLG